MEFVYSSWHTHIDENLDGGEDSKLIGIYSSLEKTEAALTRAKVLDGFKLQHVNFAIDCNRLDVDGWNTGFITGTD